MAALQINFTHLPEQVVENKDLQIWERKQKHLAKNLCKPIFAVP
jgi:hypothetical protein